MQTKSRLRAAATVATAMTVTLLLTGCGDDKPDENAAEFCSVVESQNAQQNQGQDVIAGLEELIAVAPNETVRIDLEIMKDFLSPADNPEQTQQSPGSEPDQSAADVTSDDVTEAFQNVNAYIERNCQ